MINYVIVEKESHLIQESDYGMLCVFTSREQAESFLRIASRPASELVILECEVKRWRKLNHLSQLAKGRASHVVQAIGVIGGDV